MAVPGAQPPPEFVSRRVGELDEAQRGAAQQVLLDRFAQGKENMSAHNRKIVNTLLGFGHCALHCHRANCELGRAELGRFGCALGMVRGRCVAAAVFRHVPAASRREGWSELLLLAVRRDEERRGYGTAMVEYVRRLSAASGASLLVVISNGSAFWQRPALRLGELAAAEAGRYPCFVPWSHGIKLLGSRPEVASGFERATVAEEYVDGNRAASHRVQQAGAWGDPLRLPPSRLATPGARGKRRAEAEAVEVMEASPSALVSPVAGDFAEPAQAAGSRPCAAGRPQQRPASRKKKAAAGQGTKAVAPSAAVAGRGPRLVSPNLVSPKTAAAPPDFVSRGVRELDEAQRGAAQQVLLDRFAQGRDDKSSHNRKVVNTLLGCMPHRARTPD
jgi:GNAT superfamily N-acetyltransferase